MDNLKAEFVTTELRKLLIAIDNKISYCTYMITENGEEIVSVWWTDDFSNITNKVRVCVTGDSLAQLTIDVIKKAVM